MCNFIPICSTRLLACSVSPSEVSSRSALCSCARNGASHVFCESNRRRWPVLNPRHLLGKRGRTRLRPDLKYFSRTGRVHTEQRISEKLVAVASHPLTSPAMPSSHTPLAPLPISPPKPFTIHFPEEDVSQFQRKLKDARLPNGPLYPDNPETTAEDGGSFDARTMPSLNMLRQFIDRWTRLDLKALEKRLNQYPHFTTSVSWCKQLHFLHQPSSKANAIPLILIHGWPGSFLEFVHIIHALAEPEDPEAQAFHVVVPSLPGFTFSSGPPTDKHGVGDVDGYCHLFDSLMRGLGYDRYAAQGGECGNALV